MVDYFIIGTEININEYELQETKNFYKALDKAHYANYVRSFKWEDSRWDGYTEGVEFDIQTSAFSKTPIRNTERTCTIFGKDKLPIVFALRKDFPREMLHVNLLPKDLPVSLCLYEEPYSEIRLWLTWELFLDSIHKWYKRASDGTAHLPGQAIEPLILDGIPLLVSNTFFDTQTIHVAYPKDKLIVCSPIDLTKDLPQDAIILIPIKSEATVSRCIHYAPQTFRELLEITQEFDLDLREELLKFTQRVEQLLDINIRPGKASEGKRKELFVNEFKSFVKRADSFAGGLSPEAISNLDKFFTHTTNTAAKNREDVKQKILSWVPMIWLRLPKKRSEEGVIEWNEDIAFSTTKSLGELCENLGIYYRHKEHMIHRNTLVDISEDGSEIIDDIADVCIVKPIANLNVTMAQKLSGLKKKQEKYLALGVGALGSQVVTNLARLGMGKWCVLDRDILFPHNLSRHALFAEHANKPKAESLAIQLNSLMDDNKFSKSILCDFLEYKDSIVDYDLIFDFSASTATVRHLAIKQERKAIVSAFMTKYGKYLICLSEGNDKSVRVDDIEYQLACKCIDNEELNPVLETHEEQEIRYSGACSDITTVLPQDRVAVHSGILSSYIKQNTDKFKTIISIWELTEDGTTKRNTFVPSKVNSRKVKGWDIRISDEVLKKMMNCRSFKQPLETGGVLIGDFDLHNRIVYIVDIISSPKDSKEEPYSYIRGFEGLAERVKKIKRISGRRLDYVGEWHAHPNGVAPSRLDKLALDEQASEMSLVGLPAIMAIVGDKDKYRISIKKG